MIRRLFDSLQVHKCTYYMYYTLCQWCAQRFCFLKEEVVLLSLISFWIVFHWCAPSYMKLFFVLLVRGFGKLRPLEMFRRLQFVFSLPPWTCDKSVYNKTWQVGYNNLYQACWQLVTVSVPQSKRCECILIPAFCQISTSLEQTCFNLCEITLKYVYEHWNHRMLSIICVLFLVRIAVICHRCIFYR